jgi:ATP-dependent Clp protease protease subunit
LLLDSENPEKDIMLYINSPGGSVTAGFAIYDTMQHIRADVSTICLGQAASMGAFLLAAGAKGKRMALKRSRTMIHQPLSYSGYAQASDIEIESKEINSLKKELYEIISDKTGQNYDKIQKDSDRDYWMTAQEAKKYGMIDEIILKRK